MAKSFDKQIDKDRCVVSYEGRLVAEFTESKIDELIGYYTDEKAELNRRLNELKSIKSQMDIKKAQAKQL